MNFMTKMHSNYFVINYIFSECLDKVTCFYLFYLISGVKKQFIVLINDTLYTFSSGEDISISCMVKHKGMKR
jgi:hypothetical protein